MLFVMLLKENPTSGLPRKAKKFNARWRVTNPPIPPQVDSPTSLINTHVGFQDQVFQGFKVSGLKSKQTDCRWSAEFLRGKSLDWIQRTHCLGLKTAYNGIPYALAWEHKGNSKTSKQLPPPCFRNDGKDKAGILDHLYVWPALL